MAKLKRRIQSSTSGSPFRDYWDKNNYLLFFIGFAVLLLANYLMTFGPWDNPVSLTIAPLVMLVSYLVIFPLAIMYSKKKIQHQDTETK